MFKLGDVVRLKCGGPAMVVIRVPIPTRPELQQLTDQTFDVCFVSNCGHAQIIPNIRAEALESCAPGWPGYVIVNTTPSREDQHYLQNLEADRARHMDQQEKKTEVDPDARFSNEIGKYTDK